MSRNYHILIVLTSCSNMGNTDNATGFHYEEMATPYYIFSKAGCEVSLASIEGGHAPHDPGSLTHNFEDNPDSVRRFLNDVTAQNKLKDTIAISSVNAAHYDSIFLAGGHGTMWDFPEHPVLSKLLSRLYQDQKPMGAVCHGVAGFVGAVDEEGKPIVAGKNINSFTNAEEIAIEKDKLMPFMLESKLQELGAHFECSDNFKAHIEVDGQLVTGQNPASAKGAAEALVTLMRNA